MLRLNYWMIIGDGKSSLAAHFVIVNLCRHDDEHGAERSMATRRVDMLTV